MGVQLPPSAPVFARAARGLPFLWLPFPCMTPGAWRTLGSGGDATKDAKRDFAVATNRRALHDYFVEQTIECGHRPHRHRGQVAAPGQGAARRQLRRSSTAARSSSTTCTSRPTSRATARTTSRCASASCCSTAARSTACGRQTAREGLRAHPAPALLHARQGEGRARRVQGQEGCTTSAHTIAERDADREVRRALRAREQGVIARVAVLVVALVALALAAVACALAAPGTAPRAASSASAAARPRPSRTVLLDGRVVRRRQRRSRAWSAARSTGVPDLRKLEIRNVAPLARASRSTRRTSSSTTSRSACPRPRGCVGGEVHVPIEIFPLALSGRFLPRAAWDPSARSASSLFDQEPNLGPPVLTRQGPRTRLTLPLTAPLEPSVVSCAQEPLPGRGRRRRAVAPCRATRSPGQGLLTRVRFRREPGGVLLDLALEADGARAIACRCRRGSR